MDPKTLVMEMIQKLSETDPAKAVEAATGFYVLNSVDEKLTALLTILGMKAAEDTAFRKEREEREAFIAAREAQTAVAEETRRQASHALEMKRLERGLERDEEKHQQILASMERQAS